MIDYKKLSETKGWDLLSHIWTVFISKDSELWVNPFQSRSLRYLCLMNKAEHIVYLYVDSKEIGKHEFVLSLDEDVFFSGAFNQVTVYQVRTRGKLAIVGNDTKEKVILLMEQRLRGKKIPYDNFRKYGNWLNEKEKTSALESLYSEGILYSFKPSLYEYHIYERG